jgi:hypothetical protein
MSDTTSPPPAKSSDGHRERVRRRFIAREPEALTDEALLELLLSYSIPRRDVQPLAKHLLAHFGSLNAVLAAKPTELRKVRGIKDTSIALVKLVQHLRQLSFVQEIEEPARGTDDRPAVSPTIDTEAPTPDETVMDRVATAEGKRRTVSDRKLQVSNGYLLETTQLARILAFVDSKTGARKITAAELVEGTGLSARQVENLVSMGSALGLIVPRTQLLTEFGHLVKNYDPYLGATHTLEFCHFLAAGQPRNLIWFEIFNNLLPTEQPMGQAGWSAWLREKLAGQYSERSLMKHVAHEVRFILDAYLHRNFNKLNLHPLSLAAMIYKIGEHSGARLVPFSDIQSVPGSPGRIFALNSGSLRQMIEVLHQRAWLRIETRHGLDQIRLVDELKPLDFLAAAYENREPVARPVLSELAPNPELF